MHVRAGCRSTACVWCNSLTRLRAWLEQHSTTMWLPQRVATTRGWHPWTWTPANHNIPTHLGCILCAAMPNMGCIHTCACLQVLVGGHSTTCVVQQFDTVVHLVGAEFNHCVVATTCGGHEGLAPMDMDASKPRDSFNVWTHAQLLECLKWGTPVYVCLPTFDRWGLSNTCVVQQFDTGVVLSIVVE